MRTLFWGLVLANLGFLFWVSWDVPPVARPAAPVAADSLRPLAGVAVGLVPRVPSPSALGPGVAAVPVPVSAVPTTTPTAGAATAMGPAVPPPVVGPQPGPVRCVAVALPRDQRQRAQQQLQILGLGHWRVPEATVYQVVSPAVSAPRYRRLDQQAQHLHLPHAPTVGGHRLSYGVFSRQTNAERALKQLASRHVQAEIKPTTPPSVWVIGPLSAALQARLLRRLKVPLVAHVCAR